MSPGIKSDTSKRLSALLLRGWAMLGENCPDCQVPLMKERTTEERLCVNCDTTFIPDGQGLRPTNRTLNNQPDVNLHQQQQEQSEARIWDGPGLADGLEEESHVYDPRADPRLGPFVSKPSVRQEDTTSSHSQGATTAKREESGSLCSNNGIESAREDLSSGRTEAVAAATATSVKASGSRHLGGSVLNDDQLAAGPCGAPNSAAASTDASEDVADLLAAKMLQGWALLDKYCPRCNTVLVRSKVNKRMFCVACDAWVVSEADTLQQQEQQQARVREEEKEKEQQPITSRQAACAAAVKACPGPVAGRLNQPSPASPSHQEPQQQLPSVPLLELPERQQQQQQALQDDVAPLLPLAAGQRGLAVLGSEIASLPELSQLLLEGSANVGGMPVSSVEAPRHQHQQHQPQLPPMYQQFFTSVAPRTTGGGSGTCSRGSPPPQTWPGQSPSLSHEALLSALRRSAQHQQQQHRPTSPRHATSSGQQHALPQTAQTQGGNSVGHSSSGKQPTGTSLLLSIGRTVALKMAEAQGLLERTPALDTERARSYVALISECLDLLSKLHSLQQ